MVAVTAENELLLVEQYRPPPNARVIELPAGLAGDDDGAETLTDAARRELLEETGYHAGSLVKVAEGPASAGATGCVIARGRTTSSSTPKS